MIQGGNATIYVSDFEVAVTFYTQALGLKLRYRAGNDWAEVEAGKDLVIGIHPQTPDTPKPGVQGSIQIGLVVREPMEDVMRKLTGRGVKFVGPVIDDKKSGFRFAFLHDPDGNGIYLWEMKGAAQAEDARPARARREARASRPA